MSAVVGRGLIAVHPSAAGGTAALRGLDLDVPAGALVAVVGPSGSGKTSLLRILAGGLRPTAGTVEAFGVRLERASAAELHAYRRDTVAVVDQHYRRALSPYLPAREIVALPLAVRGVPGPERAARAAALLDAVGLASRAGARVADLSGGEQQRLALAAALSTRPRLLLADEPTGELDATTTAGLLGLLRELVRAEGATAVVVTHDAAVEAVADAVVILQDGRAVAVREGPDGHPERPSVDEAGWHAPTTTWRHRPHAVTPGSRPGPAAGQAAGPDDGRRTPSVVLDGVARRYGRTAGATTPAPGIAGVAAVIADRGVHLVVGPSGSGKSTLLRIVAGLDRPDAGRVVVLGRDLGELDREGVAAFRAAGIGLAEQARGLVPFLDVRENLALALAVRRSTRVAAGADAEDPTEAILASLGIAGLGHRRPAELSAGERTRATIGRALVGRPALLLLDEPTATLDRVNSAAIAELLLGLGATIPIVVATHDPALLAVGSVAVDLGRTSDVGRGSD